MWMGPRKTHDREPPSLQYRNCRARANDAQTQPVPALREQSDGPFTGDRYRIRQSVRSEERSSPRTFSLSGTLLRRDPWSWRLSKPSCLMALWGSSSLRFLLGSFCLFVSFGSDLHSCLCSIIFPFTSDEGFYL